jgi:murein DD-endopeptidase MepM/ murein hydrolase activator NlpD
MNYFKILIFSIAFLIPCASIVKAQSIDELKSKISDRNEAINRLEQEIKQYQTDIEALGKEKDSLSNTVKSLDISKKKLEADTKITENKIAAKNLEIKELSFQIGDKSDRIVDARRIISRSFFDINQMNSASTIESLLGKNTFSDFWKDTDELVTLQANMQDKIKELEDLKTNLEENKKLTEKKKSELVILTNNLKDQTKIVAETVKEKNSILTETKNTEANYKKILAAREAQKKLYEREVFEFESALKIAIDPSSIPSVGKGILKWPLDNVRITQYFGNTEFATKNPQVYKGSGHNGIDFGTPIGTPVKAAMEGVVLGAGNTSIGRCLSYGKWIMIKHPNGLTTLYGHLSLISVVKGQQVSVGEKIGYSGNTGNSTGPHLHFGVYASEGVRIGTIPTSINCRNVVLPLSDTKAYLNPLSYL